MRVALLQLAQTAESIDTPAQSVIDRAEAYFKFVTKKEIESE